MAMYRIKWKVSSRVDDTARVQINIEAIVQTAQANADVAKLAKDAMGLTLWNHLDPDTVSGEEIRG